MCHGTTRWLVAQVFGLILFARSSRNVPRKRCGRLRRGGRIAGTPATTIAATGQAVAGLRLQATSAVILWASSMIVNGH